MDDLALNHLVTEAEQTQINREKIFEHAVEEISRRISEEDATQNINADWLNMFSQLAGTKSSEEIQGLFGRILASEIRLPGLISLRTLAQLATFDAADANTAYQILSKVTGFTAVYGPLEVGSSIDVKAVMPGIELGILQPSMQSTHQLKPGKPLNFDFADRAVRVTSSRGARLSLMQFRLTRVGSDLKKLMGHIPVDQEYFSSFADHLSGIGSALKVETATVFERSEKGFASGEWQPWRR